MVLENHILVMLLAERKVKVYDNGSNTWVPNVLGLQLSDILASIANGEGFWELQFKNTWVLKDRNHWYRAFSMEIIIITILFPRK